MEVLACFNLLHREPLTSIFQASLITLLRRGCEILSAKLGGSFVLLNIFSVECKGTKKMSRRLILYNTMIDVTLRDLETMRQRDNKMFSEFLIR